MAAREPVTRRDDQLLSTRRTNAVDCSLVVRKDKASIHAGRRSDSRELLSDSDGKDLTRGAHS